MSNPTGTDPAKGPRQLIRTSRRVTRWTFSMIQLFIFLSCGLLVTWVVNYNPVSWDLTEEQLFSLSAQSRTVLQTLDEPVELVAFVAGAKNPGIERLLLAYDEASPQLSYRLVDPEANPALAAELGVRGYDVLFARAGEDPQRAAAIDEPSITNAVLAATRGEPVPVCFTAGHGERAVTDTERVGLSAAATALTQTNYRVDIINISAGGVPEACRVVVIAGPQTDLLPEELAAVESYLEAGGRLLLMFESRTDVPGLTAVAAAYGLQVNDDFIIDTAKNGQAFGLGLQTPLVDVYEAHPITESFRLMSMFNMPRSITFTAEGAAAGTTAVAIAATSPGSWGETGAATGEVYTYDDGAEQRGPLPLLIAVAEAVEETPRSYRIRMREGGPAPLGAPILVASGDADFASNAFFGWQGNGDLFLNSVSWLAGQEELISIRPKEVANKRVVFSNQDRAATFFLLVVLLPMIPAVTGVVIMFRKVK
jgi:ABC-type uncharacterized transport system involved in gliding motility auxiliary subunit